MKMYNVITIAAIFVVAALAVIPGCKYDVVEPKWYTDPATTTTPQITSVTPANEAAPGVNTITIQGVNFGPDASSNFVYFGSTLAEIKSASTTQIVVYRPNLVADSSMVKVSPTTTYNVTNSVGPYKIDNVIGRYGSILDNLQLNAVAIDTAENLYVIKGITPFTVYKITPAGVKTTVGAVTKSVFGPLDAKIGPDGNLYYMGGGTSYILPGSGGGKVVGMFNIQTGTDSSWYTGTKYLTSFDFAANGYIYAGGNKSSLLVIRPNKSIRLEATLYAADTIFGIRVFGTNLYVAAGSSTSPQRAIWCHSLTDTSVVGTKTPFFDLSTTEYAYRTLRSISFSADGSKMYLGFNSPNPILVVDVATKNSEILYKGIIPDYCRHFCFGNMLYMISGSASSAVAWDVYRVDVGTSGAPYY